MGILWSYMKERAWAAALLALCTAILAAVLHLYALPAEAAGYGHTYIEGPGDHEWPYWDKAVQLAFQFFCGLDMASTPIYYSLRFKKCKHFLFFFSKSPNFSII